MSIGIVGGSLAGLFQAVTLSRRGFDVAVWERSRGRPVDRGAGIVLKPGVERFLSVQCGVDADSLSVPVSHHQIVDIEGHSMLHPRVQRMTSWGNLYRVLRESFETARYLEGDPVVKIVPRADGATVETESGTTSRVDVVIIAEGGSAQHRPLVTQSSVPRYVGYVAYRGVVDQVDLPASLAAMFRDRFSSFEPGGTQFLCYPIPGEAGSARNHFQRINWVWYVNASDQELRRITTDRNGRYYGTSLPPGAMAHDVRAALKSSAEIRLPAGMASLVHSTVAPFVQAVQDGGSESMRCGRVLLTGDAAFVVRPHTAASAEKAAEDALELRWCLKEGVPLDTALDRWERARLAAGTELIRAGIDIGNRLRLGLSGWV